MSEIDLDELGRIKAIEYFESIKDFVPLDTNGKPDISKLKEKLINLDMSQNASKYIVSVFPEFFARGRDALYPYYVCCAPKGSSMEDLYKGDFSFLEGYEKDFPLLQRIAVYLCDNDNKQGIHKAINDIIIQTAGKEFFGDVALKYPQIFEQVALDDSIRNPQKNGQIELDIAKSLLRDDKDNEYLQLGVKVLKFGKDVHSGQVWEENRQWKYYENELNSADKQIDETKEKLAKVQKRLGRGKGKIRAFLAKFRRGYKNDEKSEEKLQKTIENITIRKEKNQETLDEINRENRLKKLYKEKYGDMVIQFVNSFLKQAIIKDSDSDEDKKKIGQMIDRFIEYYYSKDNNTVTRFDLATGIFKELLEGKSKEITWDSHIARFYNPIIATCGISEAFLEFEKLENKDIFTIIQIIRNIFEGMSSDYDHDIPEKGYRTFKIGGSGFLKTASKPEDIPKHLENLNIYLQQVLNEKDLEQYVRGVYDVYSTLEHIHPLTDGNGRLGKYLIRILLAHRGIIAPAFYKKLPDEDRMNQGYVDDIIENSFDITGYDRLHQREDDKESEDTSDYGGK